VQESFQVRNNFEESLSYPNGSRNMLVSRGTISLDFAELGVNNATLPLTLLLNIKPKVCNESKHSFEHFLPSNRLLLLYKTSKLPRIKFFLSHNPCLSFNNAMLSHFFDFGC